MSTSAAIAGLDPGTAGPAMYDLVAELYPLCRSITGDGVRETLRRIQQRIPLEIHEVPTGTRVFDWTVPREWNIRDAYIRGPDGERVVDFRASNLHVVGYSVPVQGHFSLEELRPRLHTLPDHPSWIPYRTSYYEASWGFCLSHERLQRLQQGSYEVCIDSSLEPGSLTYGECYLPGESEDEVLFSCHVCHPSLCNDNLSGIALTTLLAATLAERRRRYSYRFLFLPVTIGAITWLARNQERVGRIRHGLVVSCVGDGGPFTYKRSRRGNAEVDQAAEHVLAHAGVPYSVIDFIPYGYDERQYCSPGFDLPVGCLMRTPHGRYPEYHTSADDLSLVRAEHLAESLARYLDVVEVLEGNGCYRNLNPKCEPQLGRRGLYAALGGGVERRAGEMALLWVLNASDGGATLLDVAERAKLPFALVRKAADLLLQHGLLEECPAP